MGVLVIMFIALLNIMTVIVLTAKIAEMTTVMAIVAEVPVIWL